MWEQLSATNPPLVCSKDIELFVKYQDRRQFMHFMMGLHEDFEPTRASLLSRSPTSSAYSSHVILWSCIGYTISTASHCCIHYSSTSKL